MTDQQLQNNREAYFLAIVKQEKKTIETVFIFFLVAAIDKPHLIARLNEMEKNVSEVRYKIVFN